jgi:hypothetical protein
MLSFCSLPWLSQGLWYLEEEQKVPSLNHPIEVPSPTTGVSTKHSKFCSSPFVGMAVAFVTAVITPGGGSLPPSIRKTKKLFIQLQRN